MNYPTYNTLRRVLSEVDDERERQDAKWGEQNHPNGTGGDRRLFRDTKNHTYGRLTYNAKAMTDHHAVNDSLTYADIFVEEVFEALAEDDPVKLRAELIQVAAVAVAWVEAIDRRSPGVI